MTSLPFDIRCNEARTHESSQQKVEGSPSNDGVPHMLDDDLPSQICFAVYYNVFQLIARFIIVVNEEFVCFG